MELQDKLLVIGARPAAARATARLLPEGGANLLLAGTWRPLWDITSAAQLIKVHRRVDQRWRFGQGARANCRGRPPPKA